MAEESLVEAFERLGVRSLPPIEDLEGMTEADRREALAASTVTSEQFEQLPAWYRDKLRRRGEETLARRDADRAAARRVS